MNESLQFSKLASTLLRELEDIASTCEEDDAVHSRSIEVILGAFERVEYLISQRKLPNETAVDAEHFDEPDDQVN